MKLIVGQYSFHKLHLLASDVSIEEFNRLTEIALDFSNKFPKAFGLNGDCLDEFSFSELNAAKPFLLKFGEAELELDMYFGQILKPMESYIPIGMLAYNDIRNGCPFSPYCLYLNVGVENPIVKFICKTYVMPPLFLGRNVEKSKLPQNIREVENTLELESRINERLHKI